MWPSYVQCFYSLLLGQLTYSFELDTLLSGWAHMKMLGAPDNLDLTSISDPELRSFAGESFAAPCASAVFFAFYANPHAPWWAESL